MLHCVLLPHVRSMASFCTSTCILYSVQSLRFSLCSFRIPIGRNSRPFRLIPSSFTLLSYILFKGSISSPPPHCLQICSPSAFLGTWFPIRCIDYLVPSFLSTHILSHQLYCVEEVGFFLMKTWRGIKFPIRAVQGPNFARLLRNCLNNIVLLLLSSTLLFSLLSFFIFCHLQRLGNK